MMVLGCRHTDSFQAPGTWYWTPCVQVGVAGGTQLTHMFSRKCLFGKDSITGQRGRAIMGQGKMGTSHHHSYIMIISASLAKNQSWGRGAEQSWHRARWGHLTIIITS
eukprot:1160568-Pelagomonas_calceolata.AAC.8